MEWEAFLMGREMAWREARAQKTARRHFFSESLEKKKTTCRKGDDGGCDSSIQFSRSYSL